MAYTKVGAVEPAKAAYQKVINLNTNDVLVDYAKRARNCLTDGVSCAAGGIQIGADDGTMDDLDKFIAAPYGNGMSPEMTEQYRQQQLDAIQNKINNGKTLSPEDVRRLCGRCTDPARMDGVAGGLPEGAGGAGAAAGASAAAGRGSGYRGKEAFRGDLAGRAVGRQGKG